MLYKPSERILVLGDGDCSFSRSLVQLFSTGDSANESGEGGCHVTCTTFDDEKTLLQKYGTAQDHVQVVRFLPHVFPFCAMVQCIFVTSRQ
jgi:hypothetical protein